jgi:hypothetical protein
MLRSIPSPQFENKTYFSAITSKSFPPFGGTGRGPNKKRASRNTGPFCKISFRNNKILPADPERRTEVIKPIKKAVVTCTFHFALNMPANIEFLFQIKISGKQKNRTSAITFSKVLIG